MFFLGITLSIISLMSYASAKRAASSWDDARKSEIIYTIETENGHRFDVQAPPKTSIKVIGEAITRYKSDNAFKFIFEDPKENVGVIIAAGDRPVVSSLEFTPLFIGMLAGIAAFFLGRGLRYLVGNE
jgi:hypothetical protein